MRSIMVWKLGGYSPLGLELALLLLGELPVEVDQTDDFSPACSVRGFAEHGQSLQEELQFLGSKVVIHVGGLPGQGQLQSAVMLRASRINISYLSPIVQDYVQSLASGSR